LKSDASVIRAYAQQGEIVAHALQSRGGRGRVSGDQPGASPGLRTSGGVGCSPHREEGKGRMRRRFVHLVTTLGLLAGMLAGVVGSASAAPDDPSLLYWLSPAGGSIFFPWVPNDDSLAGIDGVSGSVTVQNVEIYPVDVTVL